MLTQEKKILFISPSDIYSDSRILKQIAVAEEIGFRVLALGVKDKDNNLTLQPQNIKSIRLRFRISPAQNHYKVFIFLISIFRFLVMSTEVIVRFLPRAIQFKPQIIHCSDYLFLPLALMIKLFSGSKLIYDAHELESQTNSISKLESLYIINLEKIIWPKIDFVFYVSNSIQEWYERNIGPKNSEVILNSPILPMRLNREDYLRNLYKIPSRTSIFIYLGMVSRGRGINLALDVFRDLNPLAAIVFMGDGELKEKVKDFSNGYHNIFYHEPVEHEKVVEIASSADYGYCLIENVSLSDYFCLPNKLFEYIFSGLPVIGSDFPEIAQTLTKYNLGVVSDLNVDSIKSMILELISKDKNKFFGTDIFTLSWKYQAEKLETVFSNLIVS